MGVPPAAAGIDMGGTKILGVAYDLSGKPTPLAEHRVATPIGDELIVEAIADVVASLRLQLDERDLVLGPIGLGAPGLVDRGGTLRFAPNLPGVIELAMGARMADKLGRPVTIENDATCAAWAEHEVGAAQADEAIVITQGTGIGAGIITGGILRRGAHGFAGEAGHMVVDPNGPPCPCGRRGCWERYASGTGLGRLGRDAALGGQANRVAVLAGGDPEDVKGEHVVRAAREGDHQALHIVEEFARWVAVGLANLVNLLDPEVAVFGGGLVVAADLFLEPIRRAYTRQVYAPDHRPPLRIEAAQVGEDAGALGAALLAATDARASS